MHSVYFQWWLIPIYSILVRDRKKANWGERERIIAFAWVATCPKASNFSHAKPANMTNLA